MPTPAVQPRAGRHVHLGRMALALALASSMAFLGAPQAAGAKPAGQAAVSATGVSLAPPRPGRLPLAERSVSASTGKPLTGAAVRQPAAAALLGVLLLGAGLSLYCLRLTRRLHQQGRRLKQTEQALLASKAALAQRADRDLLTGLSNPASFQKQALQQIREAERYGHALSLVLLDIDAFKAINDNHGLRVGDGVLCSLARLLARHLRESDQLCRWGGEAFLVLVPHTDPHQAMQLAYRLRSLLARNPLLVDRAVTASFGVAGLQQGAALGDLLRLARQALLRAKAAGRNRIECAQPKG